MIRYLDDNWSPAWHCTTCEVGWASPLLWPLCWSCRRRGERGDVRRLVAWFEPDAGRQIAGRSGDNVQEARRG